MKVVLNGCYGGFSLSPKATRMYWEAKGKKVYFFKQNYGKKNYSYTPITEEQAGKDYSWVSFSSKNPSDETFGKLYLTNRPEERTDPDLVRIVEELGEEANGTHAELKIVEIPDGINWEIDEYDGIEHVAECHNRWY